MISFIDFLHEYGGIIFAAIQVMLSLAIYGKFSNKFLKEFLRECDILYHRKIEDAEKAIPTVEQTFSETRPAYVLNESTNELERLPSDEDIQAKIDSFLSSALDRILERYLPQDVEDSDDVADYASVKSDLSDLGEMYERAEEYRERYGLPDTMTVNEVFSAVQAKADELAKKIAERSVKHETQTQTKSQSEQP